MYLRTILLLSFLFKSVFLSATVVTIDVRDLKHSSNFLFAYEGSLARVPEEKVFEIEVEHLPTLIQLCTSKGHKIITLENIWLKEKSLRIEGALDNNTVKVSPSSAGEILENDIHKRWAKHSTEKQLELCSSKPFLAYLSQHLTFYKTKDLKKLIANIPKGEQSFWATAKIKSHLKDLENIGFNPASSQFEHFSAVNKSGKRVRFDRPKGKFLLIDFTLTGCYYCIKDMPKLVQLNEELESEIKLVSIWADKNHQMWLNSNKKHKDLISWASLRDSNGSIAKAFKVDTFPTYVLVDPNGKVVKRWEGSLKVKSLKKTLKKGGLSAI